MTFDKSLFFAFLDSLQIGEVASSQLRLMGSRSNLYKNDSISYKKDLSISSVLQNLRAYNITAGNAPLVDSLPVSEEENNNPSPKRRRVRKAPAQDLRTLEDNDGPMSHHDYIAKRREEVSSSQTYEELSFDVLLEKSSGVGVKLVGYDDAGSTSSRGEDKDMDEAPIVGSRSEQRFPSPGEPVCVVCGRFGEYICDETDDDICSLDCKAELLESLKIAKQPLSNQIFDSFLVEPQRVLPASELDVATWDYEHNRWSEKRSILCTYKCWRCDRAGHLAEDCSVETSEQVTGGRDRKNHTPIALRDIYRKCYQIGKSLARTSCSTCRSSISLATCLDCDVALCDSAGHLNDHMRSFPSHQKYYSHKLKRLVKCSKAACEVTSIKDMMVCHHCFNKAFDKYYDMFTASWRVSGLSIIQGSICCEDHFDWHRMNCLNADVEGSASLFNSSTYSGNSVQLSDFIF